MKKQLKKQLRKQSQAKKVKTSTSKLERIALQFDHTIEQEPEDLSYYKAVYESDSIEHTLQGCHR